MKKLIKIVIVLLMTITMVSISSVHATTYGDSEDEVYEDYRYKVLDDETIEITGYNGDDSDIEIPSTINGKKVTTIGKMIFEYDNNVISITLGNNIVKIKDDAFNCCELERIKVDEENQYFSSLDGILYNKNKTTLIRVPPKNNGSILETISKIDNYAFSDCDFLTDMTIPNSVTNIGDFAFSASGLVDITIPDSITSIGEGAFYNCSSLKKL